MTNSDTVTVNLTSVSAGWTTSGQVWQSLDFGGATVWSGPGLNAPGGSVTPSGSVDLPTGTKGIQFNFNKNLDTTPGLTYSVSATFDNGCTVNGMLNT